MSALNSIKDVQLLRSLARVKRLDYTTKTVPNEQVVQAVEDGWEVLRKNKASVRLKKTKPHHVRLRDRVWSLLYSMGFSHLTDELASTNSDINRSDEDGYIDIIGVDDELVIGIQCTSAETYQSCSGFLDKLAQLTSSRAVITKKIRKDFPADFKRRVVLVEFTSNINLTDEDKHTAQNANVILFEEQDLDYYESLTEHVGPAAKYQLFADMLPEITIPGLAIRVPAIRAKMAGVNCYSFVINPEYLLKISYVSHRAKGRASDVDSYQRMLNRSRMHSIQQYISNDGVFPTNIVVNLENKRVKFEKAKQAENANSVNEGGIFGWLDIKPTYKSAWIIDGQHRLYAYSGHEKAKNSLLAITAFEGLPPSKQAELFIDINAKQKSVKRSLLQELYAELHWDSEAPEVRVRAIISKAIQQLDADPDSAFYQRLQKSDTTRDNIRCISLTSMYGVIEKSRLHIAKERAGHVLEFGPLWAGSNELTLRRTVHVLKNWFNTIQAYNKQWWDVGSGEGGGLSMNDGIVLGIQLLRSVIEHVQSQGIYLQEQGNRQLSNHLENYAVCLAKYFQGMTEQERREFRILRGVQGQTARRRMGEAV